MKLYVVVTFLTRRVEFHGSAGMCINSYILFLKSELTFRETENKCVGKGESELNQFK